MNCKVCGKVLENGATFCTNCGVMIETNNVNQNVVGVNSNMNTVNSNLQQNNNAMYTTNNLPTNSGGNKNNTTFIVLIAVCAVVIIGLGVFIGIKLLSNDGTLEENVSTSQTDNIQEDKNTNVENVGTNTNNKNKITISNYTFTLPSYLKYNNGTDYILAANNDVSMMFNMYITNVSYDSVKKNFDAVAQSLESMGATVEAAEEVTHEGKLYILVILKENGYNSFYYLTKLNSSHIVEGQIQGSTPEHYLEALTAVNELVASVETANSFAADDSKEFKSVLKYENVLSFEE